MITTIRTNASSFSETISPCFPSPLKPVGTATFTGISGPLRKGYSLVELLIVAGLLTLLATLAIPQIYNAFFKTSTAAANDITAEVVSAKARSVVDAGGTASWDANYPTEAARFTAIENYLEVNGVSPTAESQLLTGLGSSASILINDSQTAPSITNIAN